MSITFTLNGELRRLPAETPPAMTLLDWLRGAGLTGTKEGCAEGDCGACTVVIEAPDGARAPVNACLMTLGQAHGLALRGVEGLSAPDGAPHPVQAAMLAAEATQCGFCTPGIVMSLYAHARMGGDAHEALAGNLCRCTGYRPILDAMDALPAAEVEKFIAAFESAFGATR
jgi:xanthine dehydrogenase small subunit